MSELQGGQKVRVLLAQAALQPGNPPALLLDEPTKHLDLDSVHWLQDYLCAYTGVLIVISHDRHFLRQAFAFLRMLPTSITRPSSCMWAGPMTW